MLKIGAHLSISGGYHKALERIDVIGGNCLQIFSSSPRGWNSPTLTPEQKQQFISVKKGLSIDPIYFHASYLVNLADDERVGNASKNSLITEMSLASQLGIKGSIVHLGSFKNDEEILDVSKSQKYSILITNILEILTATPKDTFFIIENAGNRKIGKTLKQIAQIAKDVNDERVKVCLDTCHLYSAGYPLRNTSELNTFLIEFDKEIGIERIELWHLNDSKDPFHALRDRHENIGEGTLGISTFQTLLNHPKTRNAPFILEVPGFSQNGPDKKNIDILKRLQ